MENQPNISFNRNCSPTPAKGCCRELAPPFRYPNEFICQSQIHALCFHFFTFHLSYLKRVTSEGFFCDYDDDGKDPWSCVLFVLPRQSFLCPNRIKWIWSGEVWINKKRDILAHQKVLRHTFASCSSTQQHRFPTSCSFWKHVHTFIGGALINVSIFSFLFLLQNLVRLVQFKNMNAL